MNVCLLEVLSFQSWAFKIDFLQLLVNKAPNVTQKMHYFFVEERKNYNKNVCSFPIEQSFQKIFMFCSVTHC